MRGPETSIYSNIRRESIRKTVSYGVRSRGIETKAMRRADRDGRESRDGDSLCVEQDGGPAEALLTNGNSEDVGGDPLPYRLERVRADRHG